MPTIYAATRDSGPMFTAILGNVMALPLDEFLTAERNAGILKGMRQKKAERTLRQIALFYTNAGVALKAYSSSQMDDRF